MSVKRRSEPMKDSIFCDGACSGNGTRHAVAGWAWAYWPDEVTGPPAVEGAQRLDGGPATNQRAELRALLEAMRWWESNGGGRPVSIYTDSTYAINCTSKWGPSWRRKGWKRESGEPLQNLDLIQPLVAIWRPAWSLHHVRGHQTGSGPFVHGNNWVDRAAVAAAGGEARFSMSSFIPELEATLREPLAPSEFKPPPSRAPVTESVKLPPIGKQILHQSDLRNWFIVKPTVTRDET
jgi:ribonuclease HI